jgi:hypothetical protein
MPNNRVRNHRYNGKKPLPKPFFDVPFERFWYDHQFVKTLIEFMAVFEGMHVEIGKNNMGSESNKIYVPIRRGNADRVVNNILAGGTVNKMIRVPMFAAEIVQIEKAPYRQKGREHIQRDQYLPVGGEFPDDITIAYKKTPTPYIVHFDLALLTSNDDQKFQIMEQILTVFDPDIQIQTSDNVHEWNKITSLILDNIGQDVEYPANQGQKIIATTFQFSTVIYLQVPINYKHNFIKSIQLKLANLGSKQEIFDQYVNDTLGLDLEGYSEIANIDEVAQINDMKA